MKIRGSSQLSCLLTPRDSSGGYITAQHSFDMSMIKIKIDRNSHIILIFRDCK